MSKQLVNRMHECRKDDPAVKTLARRFAKTIKRRPRGVTPEQAVKAAIAVIAAAIDQESRGELDYVLRATARVSEALRKVMLSDKWRKFIRFPEDAAGLALHLGIEFSMPRSEDKVLL